MDSDLSTLLAPSEPQLHPVEFTPGAPVYLLAKFIPDLRRGEPRNIGVIVLHGDEAAAKFIAERAGCVVAGHVPAHFRNGEAIREWASFWRRSLNDPSNLLSKSPLGERSSPDFVARMLSTGKDQCYLEFGGELLDPIPSGGLQATCEFLYGELVADEEPERTDDPVEKVCRQFIRNYGLAKDKRLRVNAEIRLPGSTGVHVHYVFGEASGYEAIYQRIPWAPQPRNFERNVLATIGLFDCLAENKIASREKIGALLYLSKAQATSARSIIGLIESKVIVYNLAEKSAAEDAFGRLAALDALKGTSLG